MTNFEKITKDEIELALWLSDGRIDCDMCPVEQYCCDGKSCFVLILDWLKSEAD